MKSHSQSYGINNGFLICCEYREVLQWKRIENLGHWPWVNIYFIPMDICEGFAEMDDVRLVVIQGLVEDVVDEAQEVVAAVENVADVGLVVRDRDRTKHLVAHDLRETDDRIQRSPQFVAHAGQEGTLRPVGGFGGLLGLRRRECVQVVPRFEHVHDRHTGLHWQRQGSGYTLDWQQAHTYIDYLNEQKFQGKSTWRLPTMEELLTILRPPTVERDICLDPSFAPTIHWLWSADYCNKKQAWMADIVESYIGRQDLDGTASVCAVSN